MTEPINRPEKREQCQNLLNCTINLNEKRNRK